MPALAHALADADGVRAPRERAARLRALLEQETARGATELGRPRSGYGEPVVVAAAAIEDVLAGGAPVAAELRADPDAVPERAWLLVAALVGALVDAAGPAQGAGTLRAGPFAGGLALPVPAPQADGDAAELAALAFEDQVAPIDRLRASALALPGHVVADGLGGLREPVGDR